ncbi:MAG: aldo/keto reductase, partial [Cyanobacteria bacterium J06639_16]
MVKYCQTRRNFLLTALSATGGALGASACQQAVTQFQQAQSSGSVAATQETAVAITDDGLDQITVMPERPFGATGLTLPVLGLGGSASPLSRANEEAEAIAII